MKGVINRHYYVCCRDGKYEENKKPRFTKAKRPNQRPSRKLSGTCTSRIYVNEFCDGHVEVTYIAGHTGHELGVCELPHLSLPASVKDTVAMKLSLGIPADRIMEDIRQDVGNCTMRNEFLETVSRKHFLNKCDIRNIRIKVQDRLVICHQDDAQSVYLAVAELQQEPFNPVMAFKVQGSKNPVYPTLPENAFLLALQTEFQRELYRKYAGRVLCTHGTNAYRYKLITCIVPDHYGQGDYINNPQFAKPHNIYIQESLLRGVFQTVRLLRLLRSSSSAYRRGLLV
jgi:hypothetical protein